MNHKHSWVLVEYDNGIRHYLKGHTSIEASYQPTYKTQTWVCNCGKSKTYAEKIPSITDILNKFAPSPQLENHE